MNWGFYLLSLMLAYFGGWALAQKTDECPREILGYNCRGDYCDHCKYAVEEAKRVAAQPTNLWEKDEDQR